MHLFLSFLPGIVLLLTPLPSHAAPTSSSPYVQSVITYAEQILSGTPSGSAIACDGAGQEAAAMQKIGELLFRREERSEEPVRDLERSACFRSDIEILEQYFRSLVEKMREHAQKCEVDTEGAYRAAATVVWEALYKLRRFGLDPRIEAFVGFETATRVAPPPSGTTSPAADDTRCPYSSFYAPPAFGDVGCDGTSFGHASPNLQNEALFFSQMLQTLERLGGAFSGFRNAVSALTQGVTNYVLSITLGRAPRAPSIVLLPSPPATTLPSSGEMGCSGWPFRPGGIVTGEGVPHQDYFPVALTPDLAEVFDLLREREDPAYLEYVRSFDETVEADDGGMIGFEYFREALLRQNRRHIERETDALLLIRDPQQRMEDLADHLHTRTRTFASFAVPIDASSWPPPDVLPPLRSFAQSYALFLGQMCLNHGCTDPLARTIELSMRQECFSSFLMDLFFQKTPNAATLPACRSLYVP